MSEAITAPRRYQHTRTLHVLQPCYQIGLAYPGHPAQQMELQLAPAHSRHLAQSAGTLGQPSHMCLYRRPHTARLLIESRWVAAPLAQVAQGFHKKKGVALCLVIESVGQRRITEPGRRQYGDGLAVERAKLAP